MSFSRIVIFVAITAAAVTVGLLLIAAIKAIV